MVKNLLPVQEIWAQSLDWHVQVFFRSPKTRKALKIALPVLAVLALVCGFSFVLAKGDTSEKALYDDVVNYNYDQGRDKTLEQRIAQATAASQNIVSTDIGTSFEVNNRKYVNAYFAKAVYYLNVGQYQTALSALRALEEYVSETDETEYLMILYRDTYVELGNLEKALYYENLLEGNFDAVFSEEELAALNALIEENNTCGASDDGQTVEEIEEELNSSDDE